MSFKSKLQEVKNKIVDKLGVNPLVTTMDKFSVNPFVTNEKAEMAGLLKAAIIAIVALVVIVTLGSAILPGSVTTLSNTSAITGYSTWSTGTQAIWTALSVFVVLVFLLILVAILLAVLG